MSTRTTSFGIGQIDQRALIEQFVPAHHRGAEVDVVEDDLHDAHEGLFVAPDGHLKEKVIKKV